MKSVARALGLVLLLVTAWWSRAARAEELPLVIMLVDEVEAQPQLLEALRIQLAGRARVQSHADTSDPTLVKKSETASALLASSGARLVLWMEPPDVAAGGTATLLHLVGDREGRVLVLVHPIETSEPSTTNRALALKVAEVFDALAADREAAIARAIQRSPTVRPSSAPRPAEPSRAPGPTAQFVGDVGGWGATGTGTAGLQGAVVFGAGARVRAGAFVGDLAATGRVATAIEHIDDDGSVEADEGAFGAALRLAGAWSVIALGGEVGSGGRVLRATGTTPLGRVGEGDTIIPFVSLAPQATFSLTSFMELRATIGVEVALRRHRFTVNDDPILDVGTARGVASGSFVFAGP